MKINKILSPISILLFVILIISFPQISVSSALNGLNLWFNIVLPSLLPFLIANELLIGLGFVNFLGILLEPFMRKLFNVPGAGSFGLAMGFMCGYPTGAKITKDLREKNLCTKTEGERLLTFTNNSGPLFIIGAVSVGMFNNPELGLVLASAHYLAAITVGILFRWYHSSSSPFSFLRKKKGTPNPSSQRRVEIKEPNIFIKSINAMSNAQKRDGRNFGILLGDAIRNSMNLLLMIGGFIIVFSVIISLLDQLHIIDYISSILNIGIDKSLINSIINGIFEITNGTKCASIANTDYINKIAAASFIIGWAGLSVHLQVISIISQTDLSYVPYLFGKFVQGIISAIYSVILFNILLLSPSAPVFRHFNERNYSWWEYIISSGQLLIVSLIGLLAIGIATCILKKANQLDC